MARALALSSGGLDSVLAAKVIMDQGIEVTGICFKSAFFGSENAERMAAQIGMPLIIVDFTDEHLAMTKKPKHGYGKNMNPCIDCHAMMLNYAGKIMEEQGYDFLITGEVLNQRPMSQNYKALGIVQEESGYENKILRPLSALNLPPTEMEQSGMVDRNRLLGFNGKTRKPQMALAKELGIVEYPSPAGGCSLTEPNFAVRLRDLYEHDRENTDSSDVSLLRVGRHFRITDKAKIVSTRSGEEYEALWERITDDMLIFDTAEYSGSTVALKAIKGHEATMDEISLAAAIAARYSKARDEESVLVKYKKPKDDEYEYVRVKPAEDRELRDLML